MSRVGSIAEALAAGTTDRNGRLIRNVGHRGAYLVVQCTSKAGSVVTNTVTVQALVAGSTGTFYTLVLGTVSATGTSVLKIYPGATTAAGIANDVLPEWFRLRTTSGTTGTLRLSVAANLLL